MLRSLGVAGDTDTGAVLVEDLEQLTTEVIDDLYLRLFAREQQAAWSREDALGIARAVVGDPRARVAPQEALTEDPDGRPPRGCASRATCWTRSTGASGGSACSPTTTCSASSPTRSPTTTPRPAPGCGSGGRSR